MLSRASVIADLFSTAVDMPACDRCAFLESHCDDPAIRSEVEELLSFDESHPKTFLVSPVQTQPPIGPTPGDLIAGRFELIEEIGDGASAVVFRAAQLAPITRTVAVKILKPGLDTRSIISRFDAERQFLAMLDHPNIATVLDAGATEQGRPFFVMDLIEGFPLTRFANERGLTIDDRLSLFVRVCDAVHHAHTKGVIHRDIKPSNILVVDRNGSAEPQVIDFGIAKITFDTGVDRTTHTMHGQLLGTPAYMSPEQARGKLDIDTRADVYALGAVLYELLTGVRPLDIESGTSLPSQIDRVVCETEPKQPSLRVKHIRCATDDDRSDLVVARCGLSMDGLARTLKGDLDAIVMRAMAKDRTQRYQSVSELVDDLRAFRTNQPVRARPLSARYKMSRFVARNRLTVSLSALFVLVLVAATGLSISLAMSAMRSSTRAQQNAIDADEQRAIADAVQAFLQDVLTSAGDLGENGQDVTMLDVLAATTERLDAGALSEEPEVEARVRLILGNTYYELSWMPLALEHIEWTHDYYQTTRPNDDADRLDIKWTYGEMLKENFRLEECLAIFESFHNESLAAYGPDSSRAWYALDQIGNTLYRLGRASEAIPYHERAYAGLCGVFGEGHAQTGWALFNIGAVETTLGSFNSGEEHLLEAIEIFKQGHPKARASLVRAQRHLALGIYEKQGRYDEAERLLLESLEKSIEILGSSHGETADAQFALGSFYLHRGRLDEARVSVNAYRTFVEASVGAEQHQFLSALREIAAIDMAGGRYADALRMYERIDSMAASAMVDLDEPQTKSLLDRYIKYRISAALGTTHALIRLGSFAQARETASNAIDLATRIQPDRPLSRDRLEAFRLWCVSHIELGDAADVIDELVAVELTARQGLGPGDRVSLRLADTLGQALLSMGQVDAAEPLLLRAEQGLRSDFGMGPLPRWIPSLFR